MMMNELDVKKCAELLTAHDNILILTHRNPDGDTVGSSCALCSALRRMGKTAYLYDNTQITERLRPYSDGYIAPADFTPAYVVSVDIAAERIFPNGFSAPVNLCIDHHPTNSRFAANGLVCGDSSSCGEIVFRVIKCLCGEITKFEADCLYIAVSTDTGCFQYANTGAETMTAAAELLRFGADNYRLNQIFFRKVSPARLKLEGMVYASITTHHDGKIAVACITRSMLETSGVTENDLDDLAALCGRTEGTILNITIREMENGESKVSLRSAKEIDSSAICAVFGGGGHPMASGCTIDGDAEKAKTLLLAVIDEVLR